MATQDVALPVGLEPEQRPTPEMIDRWAEAFEDIRDRAELADEEYENAKLLLIEYVDLWGTVPKNAEQSKRLSGNKATFTVTRGNSIAVKEEAVHELRGALEANDRLALFDKLFGRRIKHELLEGAENELKQASMPKRLVVKITALYARCFEVKRKSPSLKLEREGDKKPRAKKAQKAGE